MQKDKITQTDQAILNVHARSLDSSLADLYDELTMQPGFRKVHQANDRAVMGAYNMPKKLNGKKTWKTWINESEIVTQLFEIYEGTIGG
ncbi:hypothetical protein Q8F60_09035 [Streptococcus constellatus]|nr:type IIL restriction-modification enzyme MmeI [Streptococcus constellatus]MDP1486165.1 hypothetical protein [Streptococcus constellatus]GAD39471.1 hypothetical protein ANG2_1798 [Streptococcus constellatus subsp. constellatus SK53]